MKPSFFQFIYRVILAPRQWVSFVGVILMLHTNLCFAQYENVWAFSYNAGVDFNGAVPVGIYSNTSEGGGYGGSAAASVCDARGNLLFYSDGSYVLNSQHKLMSNGSKLVPLPDPNPTKETSQGTIIVPVPDDKEKYYVFSLTRIVVGSNPPYTDNLNNFGRLYCSIVDMSLNGGLGDVVVGQKGILVDSNLAEQMTAVAGNDCNTVWLLTYARTSEQLKAFKITSSGIDRTPVLSGPFAGFTHGSVGCMTVSPDGTKIAMTAFSSSSYPPAQGVFRGLLMLLDFDAGSGQANNAQLLHSVSGYPLGFRAAPYGVCFSPDNTKLYAYMRALGIFQFDLSAGNLSGIINSQVLIYPHPPADPANLSLKLGPDNRIYFPQANREACLSVINYPNRVGLACQPDDCAVILSYGTRWMWGLPNTIAHAKKKDTFYTMQTHNLTCFLEPTVLSATNISGQGYLWNNGDTTLSLGVDIPGDYWVSYATSSCTYQIDSFRVSPGSIALRVNVRPACKGARNGLAWLSAHESDETAYAYAWSAENDMLLRSTTDSLVSIPAGNYQVRITTIGDCDTTLYFTIPEIDPNASFDVPAIICKGDVLSPENIADSYFTEWYWNFGDGSTSVLRHPHHTYAQSGDYIIKLTGRGVVCADSMAKKITVDAPVTELYFTKDRTVLCNGEAVGLRCEGGHSAVNLLWDFGDGNEMLLDSEVVSHAFDQPGHFAISLTAHFRTCPPVSYKDSVWVQPFPLVSLGLDSVLCLLGSVTELRNLAHNAPGLYRFQWNTGDTTLALAVKYPGTYSLTMSDRYGCATTESVKINKDCFIDIPNAFSPNGDGMNDYFFPRQLLAEVTGFTMQIFNRWGQVVFETSYADGHGWDGKFNNKEQPQGVYMYHMEILLPDNRVEYYDGNVTLVR